MMCGGPSPVKEADEEVHALSNQVRGDVEKQAGKSFPEYRAEKVSRQTVAGTNFFVKVNVGNGEYIHIRIFRPLPGQGEPSLHSVQSGKTQEDDLAYF